MKVVFITNLSTSVLIFCVVFWVFETNLTQILLKIGNTRRGGVKNIKKNLKFLKKSVDLVGRRVVDYGCAIQKEVF